MARASASARIASTIVSSDARAAVDLADQFLEVVGEQVGVPSHAPPRVFARAADLLEVGLQVFEALALAWKSARVHEPGSPVGNRSSRRTSSSGW